MFIVRAPGRVNLLGTHIDHRGGRVNPIAVRELVMVCFPRSDGRIRLANANPAYPADDFLIKDLVPDAKVENWADWTLATPSALKAAGLLGNWSSYVRAAAAYFANSWGMRDTLRGFDLFADGQLPQAAGLSSSSALVVGAAYALHVTNGREVDRRVLAEGCGQAEWYVGTRGGSGDQAAITLSRSGHVSHVDFFPMEVDWSPWRPGVSVVVCHSRIHAQKTSNARSIFNERVATYAIALLWIKSVHPEWADKLVHLRDVLHLSISVADTYRLLKALPTRAARPQILSALPNSEEELTKLFTTHDEPAEGYRVRDVCLYGFAECERSQKLAHHLREGDMVGAGLLIDLSHEGDRVTRVDDVGGRVPCDTGADDDDLDGLVEASESDDPDIRAAAELAQQPGGYAASCPELDEIVDIVRTVEGVYGAGLIGAGLGGCVEAIVENDAVDRVREALMEQYYLKLGKEPFIEVMVPVEGVCALSLPVD
jgi:N-acetylgalactosamine kinase